MANEDNRPLSNANSSELVHELPNCAHSGRLSPCTRSLCGHRFSKERVPHFCAKPLDI